MAYPEFMDYNFACARGMPNHTNTVIVGYTTGLSQTSMLVRPNNTFGMTCPAAAQYMKLSSTDANDATGGSGAIYVVIDGVLSSGTGTSETLEITGKSPNTTANEYLRVNRMYVNSAGSGKANAGILYLSENAGSVAAATGVPKATTSVFAVMAIGDNLAHDAKYYVPASQTAYLTSMHVGFNGVATSEVRLFEKKDGAVKQLAWKSYYTSGNRQPEYRIPLRFEALTDIWVEGVGVAASATSMDVAMQFVLVNDD